MLIDGGNEYFHNTIRRGKVRLLIIIIIIITIFKKEVEKKGILYMGMGISGGETGARKGPSLMPGGPKEGFDRIEPIIKAVAAQTASGACTTYVV